MMQKLVGIFLLLLIGTAAQAFINIEALRRNPKEGYTGSFNLQANGESGNTNKVVGQASTLNMYREEGREYFFLGNYKYGESNHLRDTHQGSSHLRLSQDWDNFPTTEFFLQAQFDEFKLLQARYLGGAGLRFLIRENPKGNSYFGAGIFRETEIIAAPGHNEQDWRANYYLSHLVDLTDSLQASLIAYFQPALDDASDARVRVDLGLESLITKNLSLTLNYVHQYDTRPPETVKKQDLSYLAGISLKF